MGRAGEPVRKVAFVNSVVRKPWCWCCGTFLIGMVFIQLCFMIMLKKIDETGSFITSQGSNNVGDIRTRESYAQTFSNDMRKAEEKKFLEQLMALEADAAGIAPAMEITISANDTSCPMTADGKNPTPECCPGGYKLVVDDVSEFTCGGGWLQRECDLLCKEPQTSNSDFVFLVFIAHEGENLWTPSSLAHMRTLSDKFTQNERYDEFCIKAPGNTDTCTPPLSPLNFFYAADECGEPLSKGLKDIDFEFMEAEADGVVADVLRAVAEGMALGKEEGCASSSQFTYSFGHIMACVGMNGDSSTAGTAAKADFNSAISGMMSTFGEKECPGDEKTAGERRLQGDNATGAPAQGGGQPSGGRRRPGSCPFPTPGPQCELPSYVNSTASEADKARVASNLIKIFGQVGLFAFGTGNSVDCATDSEVCSGGELTAAHVDEVLQFVGTLHSIELFRPFVDFYFDKDFSRANPVGTFSRMYLRFGLPMPGHYNRDMGYDKATGKILVTNKEQRDDFTEWFNDNFRTWLMTAASDGPMEVLYFASSLIGDEFLKILAQDGGKAMASFFFVFFFLWYMIGSGWLASCAMFEIFASVPIAYVAYSAVLGIELFGGLNAMSVYIVCAIGADDVFVFMDAYKQSARVPEALVDLESRMAWTYRRAAGAMLVTSLTTCAAFVATSMSPLAEVKSFGLFCAFVIAVDYVLVITLFTAAVVIYHNQLDGKNGCGCVCSAIPPAQRTTQQLADILARGEEVPQNKRKAEIFFGGPFADFINKSRVPLLLFFAVFFSIMAVMASHAGYASEPDQFLPADHPFQRIINIINLEFPASSEDTFSEVHVSWGFFPADTDAINVLYEPASLGIMKWDPDFKFDGPAQAFVVDTCAEAKRLPFAVQDPNDPSLRIVRCFTDDFAPWLAARNATLGGLNEKVAAAHLIEWLQGSATGTEWVGTRNLDKWGESLVVEGMDAKSGSSPGVVKAVSIHVSTQYRGRGSYQHAALEEGYTSFEEWMQSVNAKAPPRMKSGMQVCDGEPEKKWVFMNTMTEYVSGAITGAVSGVVLAFLVLLVATLNPVIAGLGMLTIAGILISVLGIMVGGLGWQLGTTESICITVLAGFAVDYCVHYAHAYMHADYESREERVAHALDMMAVSVFSGMITTFIASVILMLCSLQFFHKFGLFLFMTVIMSYVWANAFFMSALSLCGPKGVIGPDGAMTLQFSLGSWHTILGGKQANAKIMSSDTASKSSTAATVA